MTGRASKLVVHLLLFVSSANALILCQEIQPRYGVPSSMLPALPSGQVMKLCTKHGGILGGTVWPAASLLCSYLADNQQDLEGAKCVELGSGTGAVGLYAAGLGARVVLTDCRPPPESAMYTTDGTCTLPPGGSDTIMNLLHQNVKANEPLYPSNIPQVMELDWTNPDDSYSITSATANNGFDVVLASDVTHFTLMHEPLASTIARLLDKQAGVCFLSHHQRMVNLQGQDMQIAAFEQTARAQGLDVTYVPVTNSDADIPQSILVLRHYDAVCDESISQLIL